MTDESNYQRKCTSSTQDNLRDRIAEAVDRADTRASYDGLAVAMPKDVAQAIIDEFGLTVEYEQSWFVGLRDENGKLIKDAKAKRVVGKWEKQ